MPRRPFREIAKESNDADEIISRLYIGNQESAADPDFIRRKRITAIINCTPSLPNKFIKAGIIKYVRIPVDDSLKVTDINQMTAWLPFVVDSLRQLHHTERRNVLVHCHAGMQRSAIVVAAYLVRYAGMTPSQATKFIVKKRPIAFMSLYAPPNFEKSINAFYKNMKKFQVKNAKSTRTATRKPTSRATKVARSARSRRIVI